MISEQHKIETKLHTANIGEDHMKPNVVSYSTGAMEQYPGKHYVVSDIHGNKEAWELIKQKINLTGDDTLYILGDVIDRGEYGIEILQEIINTPNMKMLLGNHEYMMLNALGKPHDETDPEYTGSSRKKDRSLWYYNGGEVTHQAFKRLRGSEQDRIIKFLQELPLNISLNIGGIQYVLVHANLETEYEHIYGRIGEFFKLQVPSKAYFCVWDRDYLIPRSASFADDTRVIFGHTPTRNLQDEAESYMSIYDKGNIIGIDCGAAYGRKYGKPYGRLACICLEDGKVYYSHEMRKAMDREFDDELKSLDSMMRYNYSPYEDSYEISSIYFERAKEILRRHLGKHIVFTAVESGVESCALKED